jgi:hypothetical protein
MLSPANYARFLCLEGDVEEVGEITDADSSQPIQQSPQILQTKTTVIDDDISGGLFSEFKNKYCDEVLHSSRMLKMALFSMFFLSDPIIVLK